MEDQNFTRELRLRCLKLALDANFVLIDGIEATDAANVVAAARAFEEYVLSGSDHQPKPEVANHA